MAGELDFSVLDAANEALGTPTDTKFTNAPGGLGEAGAGGLNPALAAAGAIGDSVDSLTNIVFGIVDRKRQREAQEQQQDNFDAQFDESVRRFGLEFALKDWSTRKGFDISEAQRKYSNAIQGMNISQQMRMGALQEQALRSDVGDAVQKKKATQAFTKGFSKGFRGKAA